jgi:hypothetical protein
MKTRMLKRIESLKINLFNFFPQSWKSRASKSSKSSQFFGGRYSADFNLSDGSRARAEEETTLRSWRAGHRSVSRF